MGEAISYKPTRIKTYNSTRCWLLFFSSDTAYYSSRTSSSL